MLAFLGAVAIVQVIAGTARADTGRQLEVERQLLGSGGQLLPASCGSCQPAAGLTLDWSVILIWLLALGAAISAVLVTREHCRRR